MFRNYLKTAIRNLVRQKVYTLINVLGLAVSITACLLITIYVRYEMSYDNFVADGDRIYKMVLERKYPNHITHYSHIPHSFAKAVKQDYPEVDQTLHLFGPQRSAVITYKFSGTDLRSFEEDYFIQADSTFFQFFDLDFIEGDKKTALAAPNQVIISASIAKKYFGREDPLGKVLGGDQGENKVTGVFRDLPGNSHLRFDFIGTLAGPQLVSFINSENYTSFDSHIYLKLRPGADPRKLEAQFPKMVDRYAAAAIERDLGKSWADYKKAGNGYTYTLQPLHSIHLDPTNLELTVTPGGNIRYIYMLTCIAILIVLIACINFMNLSTARSAERAREVGVRKVMGSVRSQLIAQFLTESVILSLAGMLLAVAGAFLLLPKFMELVGKQLEFNLTAGVVAILAGVGLFVGVLAGLYPAFALSGFNPAVVMKGNFSASNKGSWLRNGLVVFQFMVSIVLIVGTIVIGQQLDYIQSKKLGFNHDQIVMVKRAYVLNKKIETFTDEIRRLKEVESAALTSASIGDRNDFSGQQFQPEGSREVLTVKSMAMDDEFAKVIGFEIKEGRSFVKRVNDSVNVMLNESAVRAMALTDPVGRKLIDVDRRPNGATITHIFTIIAIVKDFHFQSLHDEITPLVIFNQEYFGIGGTNYLAIHIKAGEVRPALEKIEAKWKAFAPDQPFKYQFLDDNLELNYSEERRSARLFEVFSGLAIVIACVGLFGLSAYTTSLRTKEIGIRKVLGSSVTQVVMLLSAEFTKLVLIAFVLAVPLSWWVMSAWLRDFAYRIVLSPYSFIIAGVLAMAIAWITVSYQSIRAAIVNPIRSLRS